METTLPLPYVCLEISSIQALNAHWCSLAWQPFNA